MSIQTTIGNTLHSIDVWIWMFANRDEKILLILPENYGSLSERWTFLIFFVTLSICFHLMYLCFHKNDKSTKNRLTERSKGRTEEQAFDAITKCFPILHGKCVIIVHVTTINEEKNAIRYTAPMPIPRFCTVPFFCSAKQKWNLSLFLFMPTARHNEIKCILQNSRLAYDEIQ